MMVYMIRIRITLLDHLQCGCCHWRRLCHFDYQDVRFDFRCRSLLEKHVAQSVWEKEEMCCYCNSRSYIYEKSQYRDRAVPYVRHFHTGYGPGDTALWFNMKQASLNHNEICCIPYENTSRTGLRNLCNIKFSLGLALLLIGLEYIWQSVKAMFSRFFVSPFGFYLCLFMLWVFLSFNFSLSVLDLPNVSVFDTLLY